VLGGGRAAERSKEKSNAAKPSGPKGHIHSSIQHGLAWGKTVFVKVKGSPGLLKTKADEIPAMGFRGDREEWPLGNILCRKIKRGDC